MYRFFKKNEERLNQKDVGRKSQNFLWTISIHMKLWLSHCQSLVKILLDFCISSTNCFITSKVKERSRSIFYFLQLNWTRVKYSLARSTVISIFPSRNSLFCVFPAAPPEPLTTQSTQPKSELHRDLLSSREEPHPYLFPEALCLLVCAAGGFRVGHWPSCCLMVCISQLWDLTSHEPDVSA